MTLGLNSRLLISLRIKVARLSRRRYETLVLKVMT
jgi:hypothetical protein